MIILPWCDVDSVSEFDRVTESDDNPIGVLPNKTATIENLVIYYSFLVKLKNKDKSNPNDPFAEKIKDLGYDAKMLAEKMIEEFKSSKLYQEKSDQERQDIIDAINEDPLADSRIIHCW